MNIGNCTSVTGDCHRWSALLNNTILKCWVLPFWNNLLQLLPQTRVMKEENSSESPWGGVERDREVRVFHARHSQRNIYHCRVSLRT